MRHAWNYVLIALSVSAVARAAEAPPAPAPSPITDRFAFTAGYQWGSVRTNGQVGPSITIAGTPFSLEHDFGLTARDRTGYAEAFVRLAERGRLRVNLLDLQRGGSVVLTQPYIWGNQQFRAGDAVNSSLNWRQLDITWTYSLLRTKRIELGAGIGVHIVQAQDEARVPARAVQQELNGTGPFATLAVDGTWLITPRFALSARAQTLHVSVRSVDAAMGEYHGDLQFRAWPNLAFGAGYSLYSAHLIVASGSPQGSLSLHVRGPEVFVRASF